ncbi:L,D-transpeptidase family protein [Arcobacter sp. FWKO B]|uniref:L,D-transpeptidase family protein n=1 Tax=Arcobacter sp. FWKO B TaxID=2593672 RepID=UPI0018A6147E|nr:L,D-transpeptidase family protein [Arcobacter sp. FWKO B]QOG11780.1 L,D-transpeptidase family protein [Arcobacter sp. FWKO B]
MFKKFALCVVLLSSVLYSNPLVDLYRLHGIAAVEKELNKSLQDVNYWKSSLKGDDLRFGYISDLEYVFLNQKSLNNLQVFKKDGKNYSKIFDEPVMIGQGNGDKQKEGDLKTPVGVYDLLRRNTQVDPFYGPLALITSYPNLYDISLGKNGHGIWIHGVPESENRDEFTQGCIAMENGRLLRLDSLIDHRKSVLLISEDKFVESNIDDISALFASIYGWQHSWKVNDLETYMSFYDKDFIRIKKGGIREDYNFFKRYKKIIFDRNERKQIIFSNINIIPYPNVSNKKLFKIEMYQDYWAPSFQSSGKKILYVELKNGKMSILTES